ncbi:hypothetical protein ES703_119401 [subsurface metagenome]
MPTEEFERLKGALHEAPTPEARKRAAEAMRRYLERRKAQGQSSRPMLVSLKFKAPYPTAIEIKDIPKELERNPEFFEHMRDVVTKEK